MIGPVYPYRGGIAHFTSALAEAITGADHEIKIISFKRQYPKFLYPGKSDRDPSSEVRPVKASYILDPLYPWTWDKTCQEIVKFEPDLVVFQWWTTFWAPAYGSIARRLKKAGIKHVFLIHNVFPHEVRPWDRLLAQFALSTADTFLTLSESQRIIVSRMFPLARVETSPIPVYQVSEGTRLDPAEAKARLKIPTDRKVVLFFGIVRPYKGLRLLVAAAGKLKRAGNPVHLLIAGEFWEAIDDYQKLIRDEGIEDWVTIDNRYIPNEEVPLFFSAADVFAAPYVGGTQSAAVKLAMNYSIPIVVTKNVSEDLESSAYPKLEVVVLNDPESLAAAIERSGNYRMTKPEPVAIISDWAIITNTLSNITR